jgi:hypothetical protein
MSNTKHTPGPWEVYDMQFTGTVAVAKVLTDGSKHLVVGPYIDTANARLIAAAPELLEAVQAFQEWLHAETTDFETVSFDKRMEMCAVAQMKADAAIAKATQP